MSQNVAFLFNNCNLLIFFKIKNRYNKISRCPLTFTLEDGCQKLSRLEFDFESHGVNQYVAFLFKNCDTSIF